jgi:predicted dehydrogenase/threonine dehydrogenase-like Zn-dependent dehydrogenase
VKQVVQPTSGGGIQVIDVPQPTIGSTDVLVQTVVSLISAGTERAVTQQANLSLLQKARARPDLVRQVMKRVRTDGFGKTALAVRQKLDVEIPLGYSAAGIAIEVGEAVRGVLPGQLVATGGAYRASHAEFQSVPGFLCVPVPAAVTADQAAFATVGAIALHGVRQAEVQTGSKVVVVGLGLVGQLTTRLLMASGCEVAGLDIADHPLKVAADSGVLALRDTGVDTVETILDWSRGRGADAVILTAAGKDSSDAIVRAPAYARDRANVVVVGDVGLHLQRAPYFGKEIVLKFARSYGPGRYERSYEEWGVDYPVGYVPFTEGRNMETVLDLIQGGRLHVDDLVTHTFDLERAASAYELIDSRTEPYFGVELRYPETPTMVVPATKTLSSSATSISPGVGFVGAGGFAAGVLLPSFKEAGLDRLVSVASATGLSAKRMAKQGGFSKAVTPDGVLDDPAVDAVVVATPHDTHASFSARALRAGKHVFVEKPLALTFEELEDVENAQRENEKVLFVGFNRRWSPAVIDVKERLAAASGPLTVLYRVNAGRQPAGHWYNDRRQGGRLLGEVCHFVDTCAAIVGHNATRVSISSYGRGETLLRENLVATLTYPDGSIASIAYLADGHASLAKERIEVLGRGHAALIDDFKSWTVDGVEHGSGASDKGHRAEVVAFKRAMSGEEAVPNFAASMRTTLELAAILGRAEG